MKKRFSYYKDELSNGKLELLLHLEDVNPKAFTDIIEILTDQQRNQYFEYIKTDVAIDIRSLKNKILPTIDFNNLPEKLDTETLNKLVLYYEFNEGNLWDALDGILTDYQAGQVIGKHHDNLDKQKEERMAALSDEERQRYKDAREYQKNNPTEFYGNMFEPDDENK